MDQRAIQECREALRDSYNRYAQGIDEKDWPLVRSCFADQIALNYTALGHSAGESGGTTPADEWVGVLRGVIEGFDITQHRITNHRFEISDELVRCRAYLSADHIIFPDPESKELGPQDCVTVVGQYSNEYQLIGGSWKICRSALAHHYTTGNPGLMKVALARVAAI